MKRAPHLWEVGLDDPKGRQVEYFALPIDHDNADLRRLLSALTLYLDRQLFGVVPCANAYPHVTLRLARKPLTTPTYPILTDELTLTFDRVSVTPYSFRLVPREQAAIVKLADKCGKTAADANDYGLTLAYALADVGEGQIKWCRDQVMALLREPITVTVTHLTHRRAPCGGPFTFETISNF